MVGARKGAYLGGLLSSRKTAPASQCRFLIQAALGLRLRQRVLEHSQVGEKLARRAVVWLVIGWPSEPIYPLGCVRLACSALHGARQPQHSAGFSLGQPIVSLVEMAGLSRMVVCLLIALAAEVDRGHVASPLVQATVPLEV
jgi:hypothetical protein